jgi:hypothetical protein
VPGQAHAVRPLDKELLELARAADAAHWEQHHRPISAEALRKKFKIGSPTARALVAEIRTETQRRASLASAA